MYHWKEERISYQVKGICSYLIVETEQELSDYPRKMVEYNKIAGLLSLHTQKINQTYVLNYEITGKRKLSDCLKHGFLPLQDVKRVLNRLYEILIFLEEYFLTIEQVILDCDYIFLDETKEVFLLYYPIAEGIGIEEKNGIKDFYLSLLGTYFDNEQDTYFGNLIKVLIRPSFDGNEFKKRLSEYNNNPYRRDPEQLKREELERQKGEEERKRILEKGTEKPKKEVLNVEKKLKVEESKILIPGQKKEEIKQETKQSEKDKKGKRKFLGGIFSKSEKKENFSIEKKSSKKESRISLPQKRIKLEAEPIQKTYLLPKQIEAEEGTVLLTGNAYLSYKNETIPLDHVPFSFGNSAVDYYLNSQYVSKLHATIIKKDKTYYIKDENSKNHTFLNGAVLPPYSEFELHSGDKIRLANEEMVFYL